MTENDAVLVADPDPIHRQELIRILARDGISATEADNADDVAQVTARTPSAFVFLNAGIGEGAAVELPRLLHTRTRGDGRPLIVVTADGVQLGTLVALQTAGALAVLERPMDPARVRNLVHQVAEIRGMRANRPKFTPTEHIESGLRWVGTSPSAARLRYQIAEAAGNDLTTLIVGETGSGKGLAARLIHELSARANGPFASVNCAGATPTLLNSELFGHAKGAFTGAIAARQGHFVRAGEGTVFLDEVGDASPELQSRLLHVLDTRNFVPVGSDVEVETQARTLAATHRNLWTMARRGAFRPDLLHRLDLNLVQVPPLRERFEDLQDLTIYLLSQIALENKLSVVPAISPAAEQRLREHSWPGNVRELRHCLSRAVMKTKATGVVTSWDIDFRMPHAATSPDVRHFASTSSTHAVERATIPLHRPFDNTTGRVETLAEVERRHIRKILHLTRWNVTRAARLLGITRGRLRSRMQQYGIKRGASLTAGAEVGQPKLPQTDA